MEHTGITLSIIIPVYNVMAYLRPCLDGLLNQTCPAGFSYEVLLADDGSTDGSGAVCEEYAKAFRQVRVLHPGKRRPVRCAQPGHPGGGGRMARLCGQRRPGAAGVSGRAGR